MPCVVFPLEFHPHQEAGDSFPSLTPSPALRTRGSVLRVGWPVVSLATQQSRLLANLSVLGECSQSPGGERVILYPQTSRTPRLPFTSRERVPVRWAQECFCFAACPIKILLGVLKVIDITGKMNPLLSLFSLFLGALCLTGLLWNPQGPRGQLAVPDVCSGGAAQVLAVPQERRSHEAHPQRDQVGPRQLCSVDPRGTCGLTGGSGF